MVPGVHSKTFGLEKRREKQSSDDDLFFLLFFMLDSGHALLMTNLEIHE